MKIHAIAITALSLLIPLVSPVKAEETRTISGKFTLYSSLVWRWDGECFGTSGLSDVRGEMDVVVKDGKGEILAIGKTEKGKDVDNATCAFAYKVENVPVRNIYTIEVGRRGSVVFSADELEKKKWVADIAVSTYRR